MRRAFVLFCVLAAAGVVAVLGSGAGGDDSSYLVRAEFRNAFSVIPGEDVKIAGVKVGKIKSLDVTPQQTAAVVLDITSAGYDDFRADATCTIRPQSLIGEKFVECTPTEPRRPGEQPAPLLKKITAGPGKGQYRLPVSQTSRPVDLDLINNILRLPQRQRLAIILNELGAGLAGHGQDLRAIIRNADPALRETDKVLELLGDENQVLSDLARDSDTILAPLARDRRQVADFVDKASVVSVATAERRADLERNLQKLPQFLRELRPTMTRLGALSDEMTPVLTDLGNAAPDINRLVLQLGPFAKVATPALKSLGAASVPGRRALVKAHPVVSDLKDFAAEAKPLASNASALLTSFRDTGGVERLMDYAFYQVAAINGFDSFGHYLRASLIVNLCSTYQTTPRAGCSANFKKSGTRTTARDALASIKQGRSPYLAREDAVLLGMSLDDVLGRHRRPQRPSGPGALQLPSQLLPGQGSLPLKITRPSLPEAPAQTPLAPAQRLLDYLLGGPE